MYIYPSSFTSTETMYFIHLYKYEYWSIYYSKMELPNKLLEQIPYNSGAKVEEHMLIVMDKSTHEEHLSQPLQTNIKQFKIAVTFLTGYNGIFNITNKKKQILFLKINHR